jgi:methionyl-tRNA synthetase
MSYDPRDDEYNVTPMVREQCEHEDVDNQGVCQNCGDEIEDWEPSDAQIFAQYGQTMEPRAA